MPDNVPTPITSPEVWERGPIGRDADLKNVLAEWHGNGNSVTGAKQLLNVIMGVRSEADR